MNTVPKLTKKQKNSLQNGDEVLVELEDGRAIVIFEGFFEKGHDFTIWASKEIALQVMDGIDVEDSELDSGFCTNTDPNKALEFALSVYEDYLSRENAA
jgi:xylose isomerase